jgi:NADPH:quinone reductase-like Zn-dependent oxidoreductase
MKSAQINKYGSSEVIEINQSTPDPTLSSGKVLVTIKAAGVNPADWKIREGELQQLVSLQFPSTLGMDFSGVIKQVGEGASASDFKQGDEIYGQAGVINGGSGAFAEMALANAKSIAHKPKSLSYVEAAALPLVGVSAWKALAENIGLSKDQKILIHGGAGGIGSIAIQLAKNLGAHVATTVSANDKEFVQGLGADQVIDYKSQNFEDSMLEQPNSELMSQYGIKAIFQFTQADMERLTKLAQWVDQNNIRLNVEKTFSLVEAGNALDYQKDVHPRGKVVLAM